MSEPGTANSVTVTKTAGRTEATTSGTVAVPLASFLGYFLRLGTFGFGGPIALAGHMQRDLVESRRWVSRQDYIEGLAFSQLSPGPLAAQLAMYLGWVRAGTLGATLAGAAFVLPSVAALRTWLAGALESPGTYARGERRGDPAR